MIYPDRISNIQALALTTIAKHGVTNTKELTEEMEQVLRRPLNKGTIYPALRKLASRNLVELSQGNPMQVRFVDSYEAIILVDSILKHLRIATSEILSVHHAIAKNAQNIVADTAREFLEWYKTYLETELDRVKDTLDHFDAEADGWTDISLE